MLAVVVSRAVGIESAVVLDSAKELVRPRVHRWRVYDKRCVWSKLTTNCVWFLRKMTLTPLHFGKFFDVRNVGDVESVVISVDRDVNLATEVVAAARNSVAF